MGLEISRTDKKAHIYLHHESDCFNVYIYPLSTFFDAKIVWETTDEDDIRHGFMPLSNGNRLLNLKEGPEGDSADIEFTFPEDCSSAQFVVDELVKILAE